MIILIRWSAIATRLPGRTDNEIKNYWNTHIRKRLLKMGIDPVTHTPRLDLLELSSLLNSTLYNSSSTSHLNHIPNYLLGNMGPLVNQNLLNLATTLLSCQPKASTSTIASTTTTNFVPQSNVQENLALDQINAPQSQFQSFQQNHFQPCTTSSTSNSVHVPYSVNETQFMQAKLEQLSQSLMESFSTITTTTSGTNCPNKMNSSTNMWQNNNVQDQAFITPSSESFVANNMTSTNNGYHDSSQSSPIINSSSENQAFVSCNAPQSVANMSFSSLLSTPSSSPYVNYSCSSTNTTHEDERDSFCSNMFMYDIANFAFNGNELV